MFITFDCLCESLTARKPKGPIVAEIPWFNAKWDNPNDSVNDLLRRYLRENGIMYINDNGTVWFLYHGIWERCTHEVKGEWVHFYMAKFEDDKYGA